MRNWRSAIKQSGRVILCGNLDLLGDTSSTSLPIYDYERPRIKRAFREEYPYGPFRAGSGRLGQCQSENRPGLRYPRLLPEVQ